MAHRSFLDMMVGFEKPECTGSRFEEEAPDFQRITNVLDHGYGFVA
jgi:hypothetical protein